jgi:hypothetical protein
VDVGLRLAVFGIAAFCNGCLNPQIYGPPRTIPVGKFQHTVGVEAFGLAARAASAPATPSNPAPQRSQLDTGVLPLAPTYQLRVGVAERVDVGLHVSNMNSLGADIKWNVIKSDVFDLAVDPGFQAFRTVILPGDGTVGGHTQIYANFPVVFGINMSDAVTIVPTAGFTYGINDSPTTGFGDVWDVKGGMLRAGLGLNLRRSAKFAIQPEITVLEFINTRDDASLLVCLFGLGFNFGALPAYGTAKATE